MASDKTYLQFILEQLSSCEDVTHRAMMGEYILYYRGKIIGGIYDNRFLVKSVAPAVSYLHTVTYETPYDGAKPMLLVDDIENADYLVGLLEAMYDALPQPKKKKQSKS